MPDGVAHFLEHKLFEKEDGDVFRLFSQYGAQPNAATSFDMTTYLFSCTSHVEENLRTLLDFVQRPYFSDASVEKEKGIIAQELLMYEDSPSHRVMYGLLQAFFGDSPLSVNIGGTVGSIQSITKEDLHACYRTFYHPGNMMLFVAGPVNPAHAVALVRAHQDGGSGAPQAPVERTPPDVPARPPRALAEARLAVSQPRVLFGYKQSAVPDAPSGRQAFEEAAGVWMDGLLGRGSDLFHRLVDEGLADMGFGVDFELTPHCGYSMIGGHSDHPLELAERVRRELRSAAAAGIDEAAFRRTKRKAIGRFFGLLDSPQSVASLYTSHWVRGLDLFATLPILERLTLDEVNASLRAHVQDDQFAVSVVWPHEDARADGGAGDD